MKKGITVAGNILADILKIIDSYPEKGKLSNIQNISMAVGGCVPNTIINLAKIDKLIPLKAFGRSGNDEYGRYVLKELQKNGINTDGIIIDNNLPTSFSDVMTVKESGERTFFHARGSNAVFSPKDINIDKLSCEIFHIGYLLLLDEFDKPDSEYGTVMARFLKAIQDKGIKTSIDVVSEQSERFKRIVSPALKYSNYVIINEIESSEVAKICARDSNGKINIENIKRILQKLFILGVKDKVIIHSPEAGFCMNKNGDFTIVPSFELPQGYIKGSVGAGDAFCAGALYSIYNNFDDEKLLKFASSAAACNLSEKDSVSGMKSSEKIIEQENIFKRKHL